MTPERKAKLIRTLQHRQPDLSLITDQVHKPRNLAALIRTCDAVGIQEIHAVIPKEGYRYRGTTSGSDRWINTIHHPECEDAVAAVKSKGMKIYAAHFSERAVDYREVDYTQPCAVLMGAEKWGVSDAAADMADEHILIPMMGMVESLNVSTAAGIILVEAQNQRLKAGMYEECHIGEVEFRETMFAWGYPDLAEYCYANSLDYPPMTEDYELVDPSAWYKSVREGVAATREWPGKQNLSFDADDSTDNS